MAGKDGTDGTYETLRPAFMLAKLADHMASLWAVSQSR